jgi:ABC-type lipoprotein export system ATPase subunit
MISLDHVTRAYMRRGQTRVEAVRGVDLAVRRGEFLVITGRSGAGKTTLLNLAGGLLRPATGRVTFEGLDLWEMSDRQLSLLRNRKMGFIFQCPSLVPSLTALENVALPAGLGRHLEGVRGRAATAGPSTRAHADAAREQATELLRRVGLAGMTDVYPWQLSAGQQQRVVVARALMNAPEVLFADEPTSDLDERSEGEIVDLLAEAHAGGVTVLMVTHTRDLATRGTRAIEMAEGRMV